MYIIYLYTYISIYELNSAVVSKYMYNFEGDRLRLSDISSVCLGKHRT